MNNTKSKQSINQYTSHIIYYYTNIDINIKPKTPTGGQAADTRNQYLHVFIFRILHYIWIIFHTQSVHWCYH